jgi:excisionase family DNA binding protein
MTLTPQQAALELGMSKSWLLRKIRAGEIGATKLGHKTIRISRSEIEALKQRKTTRRLAI